MNRQPFILVLLATFFFVVNGMAGDRISVEKNVDQLITAIKNGRDPSGVAPDVYTPYVFVMEKNGLLLVHPTLAGENLKDKAAPIYQALLRATAEGMWVHYTWRGKEKQTFARRCGDRLIIASGY
ncbi:MAG: hypothetical protein AB7E77_13335 [Desulfobulbus sp.]